MSDPKKDYVFDIDQSLHYNKNLGFDMDEHGWTEEITEENFYVPAEAEYEDVGEETEEWNWAADRPGLWENIRRKKQKQGKNYKPAKTEKEGRPTQDQLKRAQSDEYLTYADHAEADKPGPKDPRRTPAPKKDQKKGSKKNKPDSAKDGSGKVTFSKEVTAQLSAKVKEHNAKGKGSKATLGMLKAVYRRGAGAFSTSHAPKMSRHGWAIARVNAFLKLLRTGTPSNPKYTTDNDLLPSSHKRSSKGEAIAGFEYEDPKTGQLYKYERKGIYKKDDRFLVYKGKAELDYTESAEYQGRKVKLGKPFKTPGGPKKSAVYVKNGSGKVVIVRFGDPNMKIKKNIPGRRKNFRARHNCSNPGPRWKARYWSCRAW
tara:strand:+ start:778 stop:1893 length:1116 start_codon:yes stop_codon:yes gene_type:complete